MRTTLTIDDDLSGLLKEKARQTDMSFEEVVDRAIRVGLCRVAAHPKSALPQSCPRSRTAQYGQVR